MSYTNIRAIFYSKYVQGMEIVFHLIFSQLAYKEVFWKVHYDEDEIKIKTDSKFLICLQFAVDMLLVSEEI